MGNIGQFVHFPMKIPWWFSHRFFVNVYRRLEVCFAKSPIINHRGVEHIIVHFLFNKPTSVPWECYWMPLNAIVIYYGSVWHNPCLYREIPNFHGLICIPTNRWSVYILLWEMMCVPFIYIYARVSVEYPTLDYSWLAYCINDNQWIFNDELVPVDIQCSWLFSAFPKNISSMAHLILLA